jgi:hypothetical protein
MAHATGIGRLAGLAIGLGIGAALATTPGVASADEFDFQISIDGHDLIPVADTSATATSGTGDFAIAIGDGANATAGVAGDGVTDGSFDAAFADGAGSIALANEGNYDFASATGMGSGAGAGDSNDDVAISNGTDSGAFAGGDTVTAGGVTTNYPGNDDFSYALGPSTLANSGGFFTGVETDSSNDTALVFDPFGTGTNASTAFAADGNYDLAAAFGDMLHAVASEGNDIITILPSL